MWWKRKIKFFNEETKKEKNETTKKELNETTNTEINETINKDSMNEKLMMKQKHSEVIDRLNSESTVCGISQVYLTQRHHILNIPHNPNKLKFSHWCHDNNVKIKT